MNVSRREYDRRQPATLVDELSQECCRPTQSDAGQSNGRARVMSKWKRKGTTQKRKRPKDWKKGDRWSEDWDHCDPETIQVADSLFEELHAIVGEVLRGLDVATGITPDQRAVNISLPGQDLSRWSWGIESLDGCLMGGSPVKSIQILRSPEATRPTSRGSELAQIQTEWDVPGTNGHVRTVRRTVRLTCGTDPESRELSVDLTDHELFHERRWSAYLGFVRLNSNTMRYRTPDRPEGLSHDQLAAIGFSCTLTIRATIENLKHLKAEYSQGATEREMEEIVDILAEI